MNLSKKWDKEEENRFKSRSFWLNIIYNGIMGSYNPDKCHHPTFNVVGVTVVKKNDHYLEFCASCGKYMEFGKRGLKK